MKFKELQAFYNSNFSLGYLNTDISHKFALISLVCYVYRSIKVKNPDATYYSVLMAINKTEDLPEDFIKGLAIMCEDFAYGAKEFPTFEIKPKDMVSSIKNILKSYMPF